MKERRLSKGAGGSFGILACPDDGGVSIHGRANEGPPGKATTDQSSQGRPEGRPKEKP